MKIEAALLPTKVRFGKLCKNYALRILQMQDSHSVKQRVTSKSSFLRGINLIKLNSTICSQLVNWNQQLSYSESESESRLTARTRISRPGTVSSQRGTGTE